MHPLRMHTCMQRHGNRLQCCAAGKQPLLLVHLAQTPLLPARLHRQQRVGWQLPQQLVLLALRPLVLQQGCWAQGRLGRYCLGTEPVD